MRLEAIDAIIGGIYDCVLQPDRWPHVLRLIAASGENAASSVVVHGLQDKSLNRIYEQGQDQSHLRLYFDRLTRMSPRNGSHYRAVGDLTTLTMLCGEGESQEHEFFLHWVKPLGFRDMIGVKVLKSGKRVASFSVARSEIQAQYTDADIRAMEMIAPHICRAWTLADAFELRAVAHERMETVVNALAAGVVFTERTGRISYMNAAAEAAVRDGTKLQVREGRLHAVVPRANDGLVKAIRDSVEGRAPAKTGAHTVPIHGHEGGGLIAKILPLAWLRGFNPLSSIPGVAAVIVQDPGKTPSIPTDAFAKLYGLTRVEMQVVQTLLDGQTQAEAAARLKITRNTMKTHMRHIFVKTNVTRESDLIRLVLKSIPPVI